MQLGTRAVPIRSLNRIELVIRRPDTVTVIFSGCLAYGADRTRLHGPDVEKI